MGHTWRWITPGSFGTRHGKAYSHGWVSGVCARPPASSLRAPKWNRFVGPRVKYWGEIIMVCCNNLGFPDKINGRSASFSLRLGAFSITGVEGREFSHLLVWQEHGLAEDDPLHHPTARRRGEGTRVAVVAAQRRRQHIPEYKWPKERLLFWRGKGEIQNRLLQNRLAGSFPGWQC